jgi:hypothetical protein
LWTGITRKTLRTRVTLWTRGALNARRSHWPGGAYLPPRPGGSFSPLASLRALGPLGALRSLLTLRARRAGRTGSPFLVPPDLSLANNATCLGRHKAYQAGTDHVAPGIDATRSRNLRRRGSATHLGGESETRDGREREFDNSGQRQSARTLLNQSELRHRCRPQFSVDARTSYPDAARRVRGWVRSSTRSRDKRT